jgi:hypothetical protein
MSWFLSGDELAVLLSFYSEIRGKPDYVGVIIIEGLDSVDSRWKC